MNRLQNRPMNGSLSAGGQCCGASARTRRTWLLPTVPAKSVCLLLAAGLFLMSIGGTRSASAADPNEDTLKALRPFHGMVGKWKGQGSSMKSSGWQDDDEVTWGFREKDGRVSLNFYFGGNAMFKEALLTYDPATQKYLFLARAAKGNEVYRFVGEPDGKQTLRLDRDKEAGDSMDRLELKLLRGGDKLLIAVNEKKGKTTGDQFALIELFREGLPLEDFREGPHCLITGGAGRVQAEYKGEVYYVACPNTRALFLTDPDKFLKAAKGE